jgi:hypothetical protein
MIMKKFKLTLLAIATLFSASTFAQDNAVAKKGLSLSIGPDAAFPVGTFKDAGYKFGIGGSAKLAIPFATNFDATVQAGYIAFGKSKLNEISGASFTFIPFKGGVRYHTSALNGGFYVEPQAGISQAKFSNSEGDANFTYALNLGYLVNNKLDISTRYEAVNTPGTSLKMIGLRLAYNIAFARSAE